MNKNKWLADSFLRTGLRHTQKNEPCQDYVRLDKGSRGAALSDGVSSSKNAEIASENATAIALAVCAEVSDNKTMMESLLSGKETEHVLRYIATEIAARTKISLIDYPRADATLTFVYLLDKRYALVGYVGDSSVVVVNNEKKARIFTQTKDYGGATESIAHPRAKDFLKVHLIDMDKDKVIAFLLTSDGLENVLYCKAGDNSKALKNCEYFINSVFEPEGHTEIENFLTELTKSAVYDDDISVAVLARDIVTLPDDPNWKCKCGHRNHILSTYCEDCGCDYFKLYSAHTSKMSAFSSPWDFFEYMNANPQEEAKLVTVVEPYKEPEIIITQTEEVTADKATNTAQSVPEEKKAKPAESKKSKGEDTMVITKRFAFICSVAALLLCCIMLLNCIQMFAISGELAEIKKQLSTITETTNPETTDELYSATPSELSPDSTVATDKAETPADTTAPADLHSDTSVVLTVNQTTSLYPEPNYHHDVVGYALADENITLEDKKETNDVIWVKVSTDSGVSGWAPEEMFIVADSVTTAP